MRKTLIISIMILAIAGAALADGAAVFAAKCAVCHGKTGAGDTAMGKTLKIKDLGSAEVQKLSDADITKTITNGNGKMPGYKGKLTDDDIKAVVGFVRTLKK